jgi:hypothetical protein
MNRAHDSKTRGCRNLLTPSRVRRQVMAENFDKQWCEIRRHATIERDPQKLLQLTAELEKCKRLVESLRQHTGV